MISALVLSACLALCRCWSTWLVSLRLLALMLNATLPAVPLAPTITDMHCLLLLLWLCRWGPQSSTQQ